MILLCSGSGQDSNVVNRHNVWQISHSPADLPKNHGWVSVDANSFDRTRITFIPSGPFA
jgi:hypothetical protein